MANDAGTKPDGRLTGKRVLITSAHAYMGPAIAERFSAEGAALILDNQTYRRDPDAPARAVATAGHVDVLVINLVGLKSGRAQEVTEDDWQWCFDHIAHPTRRFVTAVLPQMIERQAGKIIAVTSAAPLRGISGTSAYAAARGAQNAYVRAVGAEMARFNIQINAIAQNFVIGGYAPDAMDDPRIRDSVMRDVPARRLAEGWEQAALALFLASEESNFFVGQVLPFSGGWVSP